MTRPLNPALLLLAAPVMGGLSSDYEACPEVPSLRCRNGSTCAPGVAFLGEHKHLGLPTHDSGYHCVCPDGFIGHECGVRVEDCNVETQQGPRACYHGSSCRSDGGGVDYCDCEGLNASSDPADAKFAGAMCQHESTSFCAASLVGAHSPNHQFCTNHGECVRMVAGDEPHPGCVCRVGWTGDHCEIAGDPFVKMNMFEKVPSRTEARRGDRWTGWVILIGSAIAFATAAVKLGKLLGMKKRGEMNAGTSAGAEKTVVGVGDLDPDGSATLGSGRPTGVRDVDAEGRFPPRSCRASMDSFGLAAVPFGTRPRGPLVDGFGFAALFGSPPKDRDADAEGGVLAGPSVKKMDSFKLAALVAV